MNGNVERPQEQGANYERVVNNDIILNTLANGTGTASCIVYWGFRDEDLKPTQNRFRGNIITGQNGRLLEFDNGASASDNTITDNIAFITDRACQMPLIHQTPPSPSRRSRYHISQLPKLSKK